jgi:hypothetical protein
MQRMMERSVTERSGVGILHQISANGNTTATPPPFLGVIDPQISQIFTDHGGILGGAKISSSDDPFGTNQFSSGNLRESA